jgi:hypothetical protein
MNPPTNAHRRWANVSLVLPAIFPLLVYAEWAAAWIVLGHSPIPMRDDPKCIPWSSTMHDFVSLALLAHLPLVAFAVGFSLASHRTGRSIVALALGLGVVVLNVGQAFSWWFD